MGLKTVAEDLLWQSFADVGTRRGGDSYLPASAAGAYVAACVQRSLAIVGVEVFRLDGVKVRPDLGRIADFSSVLTDEEGWDTIVRVAGASANRFIGQVPPEADVLMNFTLVSEEEWRST